jgi:DNA-binding phage protein
MEKKVGYTIKANDLNVPVDMKMSRLSTPQQISAYLKKVLKGNETQNFETDVLEVKEVIRNQPGVRLGVRGLLINGQSDPGLVIPENINSTAVPLIGEHVVVVEREGVVYYTKIVNRKGSVNENSIPGVVGDYDPTTQYGKEFKRTEVKPIKIKETSILREGRFGEVIHFDGSNNTPTIKISTQNKDATKEPYREENIDDMNTSSIYLMSEGDTIEGKKVLIQSNGIFIKGRKEIKIDAPNVKLGSKDADQSVIKGEDLVDFLNDMLTDINTAFNKAMTAITPGGVVVTGGGAAIPIFATDILALQTKLATESTKFKSKIVKTI